MKIKHVKSILSRKVAHWIRSIEDYQIQKIAYENTIVSGGAITSLIMGTKVNDYDIYFKTPEAAFTIAEYYVKKFKENPTKLFTEKDIKVLYVLDPYTKQETQQVSIKISSSGVSDQTHMDNFSELGADLFTVDNDIDIDTINQIRELDDNCAITESINNLKDDTVNEDDEDDDKKEIKLYRPVYITSNAITLKNKIQLVVRFTGDIKEIHTNYDFTHCKCAFDYSAREIYIHDEALECMLNKELRYTTSKYPLCSIFRIRKFLERGWHINAGQILKMAWDLNKLNLQDINVLKDQLIGVDHTYFQTIIEALEEQINKRKSEPENEKYTISIDEQYLYKLINYIF